MQKQVAYYDISQLLPIGITLVVLALVVAYGLQIMGDVKDDMTPNSAEANATASGITAVAKINTKLSTVVTIVLAAVVIGVLVRSFMYKN